MFDTATNRQVVGLDIGSSAVKMVSFRSNGDGYEVTAAAMSKIESVDDGKGPSQRAIITAIKMVKTKKNLEIGTKNLEFKIKNR